MSPTTMHELVFPLLIGAAFAAASPLHAQGPAVELEGYYAAESARVTALDARARAARGVSLMARVPETRQQAIDEDDAGTPPTSRDDATSPLIAEFEAPPPPTRR